MCLAVPAQVLEIGPEPWQAKVDYLGSQMLIGTALLEGVMPGQFVLVHVGEAIQVIDEVSARDGIALWREWLDQA